MLACLHYSIHEPGRVLQSYRPRVPCQAGDAGSLPPSPAGSLPYDACGPYNTAVVTMPTRHGSRVATGQGCIGFMGPRWAQLTYNNNGRRARFIIHCETLTTPAPGRTGIRLHGLRRVSNIFGKWRWGMYGMVEALLVQLSLKMICRTFVEMSWTAERIKGL